MRHLFLKAENVIPLEDFYINCGFRNPQENNTKKRHRTTEKERRKACRGRGEMQLTGKHQDLRSEALFWKHLEKWGLQGSVFVLLEPCLSLSCNCLSPLIVWDRPPGPLRAMAMRGEDFPHESVQICSWRKNFLLKVPSVFLGLRS